MLGEGEDRAGADGAAPLTEAGAERQKLSATYFDTADLRLATAGLVLRRRTGGTDAGWQLKIPAGSGARSEVRLPPGRAARTVPAALQRMVWVHSGGAPLQPVAQVLTERTVRRVVDTSGQVLAEFADDRVTARRLQALDGSGQAAGAELSWREIEVGLVDGDADLLDDVDTRLHARGLQAAGASSELAHVLRLDGPPQRRKRKPTKLTATSRAGDVVLAHVREQVAQVRAQDLPVRLDAPDAVHKMRVATRRLRSALTTFQPLFAKEVVKPLRGELKWLAGELGAARDAEVMRDRVAKAVRAENRGFGPAAAIADQELGEAYRSAHDRVLAELDGERYHQLVASLDQLVSTPPVTGRADATAAAALPRLVARSFTGVRDLVNQAAAQPDGAEREELLHDARKAAKAARYAGESVDRVFGKDATAFAQAMEAVQEALGEHQDSVLTRERLRHLAERTTSTETAFLYGRLHALEEARAEQSQHHFDDAWKAARRKSLHRWLR
ncbi:Putative Adenylate cyclase; putative CHAD domain [Modestobacter italicus]|uniref:Adenylate cyclase putative CHAD domain n=1 Tax=Modestobacter italicus (strain DSM 44449 / CECT 9708 / BC 501) TaxID=2732864 RepID=I4EYC4_MODI5|nr:CYTH and CHAD domain-containing protein [Modestobacter marinus]CCH88387.1 Putative Adenylate cyclase; putative CHAD domain [Modestobacter marinus]